MKQHKSILLIIVISSFALATTVYSQSNLKYSLSLKGGLCLNSEPNFGTIKGAEINIILHEFLYSIDYQHSKEWELFNSSFEVQELIALKFGQCKYFIFDDMKLEYQAGIAAIWGTKQTKHYSTGFLEGYYDTKNYTTLGILFEIGADYIIFKRTSIGTHLQVNINKEVSSIGFMLNFSIGKLKD